MAIKLMYITNDPEVAKIAEAASVDRIFVDMEFIGKAARQCGMDTVQNHHTIADIATIRRAVSHAELLVRVNPIHEALPDYMSSQEEIDRAIAAGADILMLPYFKTVEEAAVFLKLVDGRAKTMLLVETPEIVAVIDELLKLDFDEALIGLNDLSLGYKMKFMFEPLANGIVEALCAKFQNKGIPYGFGGIASLGKGMLPAEKVIIEHYRLGSTRAILSRSFCNVQLIDSIAEIEHIFTEGMQALRAFEKSVAEQKDVQEEFFKENTQAVKTAVAQIVGK